MTSSSSEPVAKRYFCTEPWLGMFTVETNQDVTFCPCFLKMKIGSLKDAIAAAAQAANLGDKYRVRYVEKPLTFWERIAMNMSNDALVSFTQAVLPQMPLGLLDQPQIHAQLRLLESARDGKLGVYAYCFCSMR